MLKPAYMYTSDCGKFVQKLPCDYIKEKTKQVILHVFSR